MLRWLSVLPASEILVPTYPTPPKSSWIVSTHSTRKPNATHPMNGSNRELVSASREDEGVQRKVSPLLVCGTLPELHGNPLQTRERLPNAPRQNCVSLSMPLFGVDVRHDLLWDLPKSKSTSMEQKGGGRIMELSGHGLSVWTARMDHRTKKTRIIPIFQFSTHRIGGQKSQGLFSIDIWMMRHLI